MQREYLKEKFMNKGVFPQKFFDFCFAEIGQFFVRKKGKYRKQ
jgi:hypothetical protein